MNEESVNARKPILHYEAACAMRTSKEAALSEPEDSELADDLRPGIQSVEIAATILVSLARGGGVLPLSRVAALADMTPGKTHRYLVSLTRSGLVSQDAESGHYRIGPLSMRIGLCGLRNQNPVRTAMESLPRLRDAAAETAVAAIWSEEGPVVIAMDEPDRPITLNVRVGSILPLQASALGRIFAAYSPGRSTETVLKRELSQIMRLSPSRAHDARECFERVLEEVRILGFAAVSGTLLPGATAFAAPVFDHRGRLALAVGVVGGEGMGQPPSSPAAEALKSFARDVSHELGFVEPETL